MKQNESTLPFVIGGVVLGLLLIVIGMRIGNIRGNPVLMKQFEAQAADPNAPTLMPITLPQVHLPSLPADLQEQLTSTYNQYLGGGAVAALTPVAGNGHVKITVTDLQRQGDDVRVSGTVTNVSGEPLTVPADAFSFRDSAGTNYRVTGGGSSTLNAGQSTSFELAVPIPADHGVTLVFTLPPDDPVEQMLVVQPKAG